MPPASSDAARSGRQETRSTTGSIAPASGTRSAPRTATKRAPQHDQRDDRADAALEQPFHHERPADVGMRRADELHDVESRRAARTAPAGRRWRPSARRRTTARAPSAKPPPRTTSTRGQQPLQPLPVVAHVGDARRVCAASSASALDVGGDRAFGRSRTSIDAGSGFAVERRPSPPPDRRKSA